MDAVKCPVCEGRGEMPEDFYTRNPADSNKLRTCGTCQGRGIVVLPSNPIPLPYRPHYPHFDPWNPWNKTGITD